MAGCIGKMVILRIVTALFPASMILIGLETFEKVVVLLDFSIIQMLAVLELIVCSSLKSFIRPSLIRFSAGEVCKEWQTWGTYLNIKSIFAHSLLQASTYVMLAVRCDTELSFRYLINHTFLSQDCVFWECSHPSGYVCSTVSVQFGLLLLD